jgi:GR25 family glycosyltransferase involved in LPS biosynthesis
MYSLGTQSRQLWSILYLRRGKETVKDVVVLRGPVREKQRSFFETSTRDKRIVLFSSFTTFPDPSGLCMEDDDRFVDVLAEREKDIVAWCHCFRNADAMPVPDTVPRIFISESDMRPMMKDLLAVEPVEKEYDVVAYLPSGSWNERVRNVAVATEWLSYMALTMCLRVLVVGGGGSFAPPVETIDFLPQKEFWEKLRRSRALFVASRFDASPRILTEALALDVPVLVNKDIVGGWKYVTQETGMFFDPSEEKGDRIRAFLAKEYSPRRYAAEHLDPETVGRWFSDRLSQILDRRFVDLPIDGVLFINLEERKDRLASIGAELHRAEIAGAVRVDAIREPLNGHLGCAKSHVRALEEARTRGWKRFVVLEDDFRFSMRKERWMHVLSQFLSTVERWDVFLLGYHKFECVDVPGPSFVKRVARTTSTMGYMVNEGYVDTLLDNFRESVLLLEAEDSDKQVFVTDNAIDQRWNALQKKDLFYATVPPIATSSGSWSSIMRKV